MVCFLKRTFKKLNSNRLATHLNCRKADFNEGIIKECYVVFNNKAIKLEKEEINDKQKIINTLEKLKQ